jgi:hypothetical protein
LQGKQTKRQKAYALRDAGGPMVGRFDKKIRDRWDDDNGSAELRSKNKKLENKEFLL